MVTDDIRIAWGMFGMMSAAILISNISHLCVSKTKKNFIINTLVCIGCIAAYITCITVIAKVFIPKADSQNEAISKTVTNCTVYNVTTYVNMTSKNIEYIVYYQHEPEPGIYFYSGICKRLAQCYPTINATINCYPDSSGYTIKPEYLDTSVYIMVIAFGFVWMCVQIILYAFMLQCEYNRQELIRWFKPIRVVSPVSPASPIHAAPIVPRVPKQLYTAQPTIAVYDPDLDERKVSTAVENYGAMAPSTTAPKCTACMENTPTIMFNGCNHVCLCAACTLRYTSLYCPICRVPGGKVRVYQ